MISCLYHACKNTFHIAEEIDGSATTYYLTYIDPSTDTFCGSTSVDASTCVKGICYSNYSYERLLPGCIDSEVINVTVHALNVLGNGSKSEPVQVLIGKLLFLLVDDLFLLYYILIT